MSTPTKQPWHLAEVSAPLSVYRPALALTVLRNCSEHPEILVGVRTEAANSTHSGVVSVPTQRVPEVVAESWLKDPDARLGLDREIAYLLSRKLGVADALELKELRWKVHTLLVWQGTSVIGEDENGLVTEDLTMFNACVEILDGSEGFPAGTASYEPLLWAPVTNFLKMVKSREVAALEAGLDELLFCVYGLCLESALRVLDRVGF